MLTLGQLVPAEEEQADEGGFKEESHQTFNGQRRPENIANVMRVVSPVGAELELHGDAGGHAEGKVDTEQLAPELGHIPVDGLAGHHVNSFHDGQKHRQTERERHE